MLLHTLLVAYRHLDVMAPAFDRIGAHFEAPIFVTLGGGMGGPRVRRVICLFDEDIFKHEKNQRFVENSLEWLNTDVRHRLSAGGVPYKIEYFPELLWASYIEDKMPQSGALKAVVNALPPKAKSRWDPAE